MQGKQLLQQTLLQFHNQSKLNNLKQNSYQSFIKEKKNNTSFQGIIEHIENTLYNMPLKKSSKSERMTLCKSLFYIICGKLSHYEQN